MAITYVGAGPLMGTTPAGGLVPPDGCLSGDLVVSFGFTNGDLAPDYTAVASGTICTLSWGRLTRSYSPVDRVSYAFYAGQVFVFRGVASVGSPFEQRPMVGMVENNATVAPIVPGINVIHDDSLVLFIAYAFIRDGLGPVVGFADLFSDPLSGPALTKLSSYGNVQRPENRDHMALGLWSGSPGSGTTGNEQSVPNASAPAQIGAINIVGSTLLTLSTQNQITFGGGQHQSGIIT